MTPAQIESAARRGYNAENDTFWSQDEVFKVIYEAEVILAEDYLVIEDRDTSITTVAGTRSYAYPDLTLAIKRIEYNGEKLRKTDFREDDQLTQSNSNTTVQSEPQYYQEWDETIYLRPVPDAANTLTIYRYKLPTLLTTASTALTVPEYCHSALIDYVKFVMSSKDGNVRMSQLFESRWERSKLRIQRLTKKRKRTDSFARVKEEEALPGVFLGNV